MTLTRSFEALNKLLYKRLLDIFSFVKISKSGELLDISSKDLNELTIFNLGETYRVNCIFCRKYNYYDKNHHLWISYGWGTRQLSDFGLHVGAKCFRHDCLKNTTNLYSLYNSVYGAYRSVSVKIKDQASFINSLDFNIDEKLIIDKFKLDEIYFYKESEAYKYLLNKFKTDENIRKICNKFSLKLCVDVDSSDLTDRLKLHSIYIPVHDLNGRVSCEQWRSFNLNSKYFSGKKISKFIYNFNECKKCDEIFIVEGPSDVWNLYLHGLNAICCFGKNISYDQRTILEKYFGLFSVDFSSSELKNKKFIVVLDGDVTDFELEKFCRAVKNRVVGDVYLVKLPKDKDPADLESTEYLISKREKFL